MAKIYGISGDLSGKIANTIYTINKGVNIARKYNPSPANPQTEAQVESRAKLKMLSQLAAALKSAIAIKSVALKTSRNLFIMRNYLFTSFFDEEAQIELANIQFTASSVGMVGFKVDRVEGYGLSVELAESVFGMFDQVVWLMCRKLEDGRIVYQTSKVMDITAELPKAATILTDPHADCSIHCYGIRFNTDLGKAVFGDLIVPSAEEVAKIVTSRNVSPSDYTLTETRGLYLAAGATGAVTSGTAIQVVLGFCTGSADKTAALVGAGSYSFGDEVTINAPVVQDHTFDAWYSTKEGNAADKVSDNPSYTFNVGTSNVSLFASYN